MITMVVLAAVMGAIRFALARLGVAGTWRQLTGDEHELSSRRLIFSGPGTRSPLT